MTINLAAKGLLNHFIVQLQPDFPDLATQWLASMEATEAHCLEKCKAAKGFAVWTDETGKAFVDPSVAEMLPGIHFQHVIDACGSSEYKSFLIDNLYQIHGTIVFGDMITDIANNIPPETPPGTEAGPTPMSTATPPAYTTPPTHHEFFDALRALHDTLSQSSPQPFWQTDTGKWLLGPVFDQIMQLDPAAVDAVHGILFDLGVDIRVVSFDTLFLVFTNLMTNSSKCAQVAERIGRVVDAHLSGKQWTLIPFSRYTPGMVGICVPQSVYRDVHSLVDHESMDHDEIVSRDYLHESVAEIETAIEAGDSSEKITSIMSRRGSYMLFAIVKNMHTPPPPTPAYLNPQNKATRDKLAAKLSEKLAAKRAKVLAAKSVKVDARSIDDLVADIEGAPGNPKEAKPGSSKSKGKNKKTITINH